MVEIKALKPIERIIKLIVSTLMKPIVAPIVANEVVMSKRNEVYINAYRPEA